jgi:hypothetical protein
VRNWVSSNREAAEKRRAEEEQLRLEEAARLAEEVKMREEEIWKERALEEERNRVDVTMTEDSEWIPMSPWSAAEIILMVAAKEDEHERDGSVAAGPSERRQCWWCPNAKQACNGR